MLVDYMNCTLYYPNSPSLTTIEAANNNTIDDSQCLSGIQMFLIPAAICSIVTLLVNPLILATILMKDKLRKETRYMLLVNVMISDLIFLLFNTVISTCNVIRWYLNRVLCFTLIVFTFAAYSSCVLTFTFMVVDTYLAICFPLHYHSLLSPQRTKKIVLTIWIFSSLFPLIVFLISESLVDIDPLEKQNVCLVLYYGADERRNNLVIAVCAFAIFFLLLCSVMMTYFYIKLYTMTRESGIWVSRFSRARITLLTHALLLCLYIIPAFILVTEIIMFKYDVIGMNARMWISASNNAVIMMMPRALTPLMYGLRYREITASLKHCFIRNRVSYVDTDTGR